MTNVILPLIVIFCIDVLFIYMVYDSKDIIFNEMYNDKSITVRIGIIIMISSILIVLIANIVMMYNIFMT